MPQKLMTDEELDALEPFMDLSDEEIEDIVIALMMEQTAQKRLARFRTKHPASQRIQGLESDGLSLAIVKAIDEYSASCPGIGVDAILKSLDLVKKHIRPRKKPRKTTD